MNYLGIIVFVFIYSHVLVAREYLYPVASINRNDGPYVYLIHQISLKHIELLEWNMESKVITQALTAPITPSGLKILPDNSGYSFVDQGQIYIKLFSKRSAQKVDVHEPIYNIEMLEWIDAKHCYFSAKDHEQFKIYQLSRLGSLFVLAQTEGSDCIYPQKIDSTLYYIERSFNKKKYFIKSTDYLYSNVDEARIKPITQILLETEEQPIAFLRMVSSVQGFYISYPSSMHMNEKQASCLSLSYHSLMYNSSQNTWAAEKLFDFSIPIDLLLPHSKDRLYESLLPLLPCCTPQGIYYCDCLYGCGDSAHTGMVDKAKYRNHGGTWYEAPPIKMCYYSFGTKIKTLAAPILYESFDALAPLIMENKVLYGHSIAGSSKNKALLPGMWRNDNGQVCYEIPQVGLK